MNCAIVWGMIAHDEILILDSNVHSPSRSRGTPIAARPISDDGLHLGGRPINGLVMQTLYQERERFHRKDLL